MSDYYFELKDERDDQKRELVRVRRRNEERMGENMKFEKAKEVEVNAT